MTGISDTCSTQIPGMELPSMGHRYIKEFHVNLRFLCARGIFDVKLKLAFEGDADKLSAKFST